MEKQLEIAEPYGEVVEVGLVPGQIGFFPLCGPFKCTGGQRTGCLFCPVGCHLTSFEKFVRLKAYNPKLYDFCMEELGEKKLLSWIEINYRRGYKQIV